MTPKIENLVTQFISLHGEEALIDRLADGSNNNNVLTIISNAGIHPYDQLHKRGEVFFASEGDIDFSTPESAVREIEKILIRVSKKLTQQKWKEVYLVPFGPAPLSLQIKSLVAKVLDIETTDVLHIGNGKHIDLRLNPRTVVLKANKY